MDQGAMIYLMDIDNTLICFRHGAPPYGTASLFHVLTRYASERKICSREALLDGIESVRKRKKWWDWCDFFRIFAFEETDFWQFAYEMEQEYIMPGEPDLQETLRILKRKCAGLYVSSNNSRKGILHKLRLAGISDPGVFNGFFGCTEMRHMKSETAYWEAVAEQSGLPKQNLCPVGDQFDDDCQAPASAGYSVFRLLNRNCQNEGISHPGMQLINAVSDLIK